MERAPAGALERALGLLAAERDQARAGAREAARVDERLAVLGDAQRLDEEAERQDHVDPDGG